MQQTYTRLEDTDTILREENPCSIFLVARDGSFSNSGAKERLDPMLSNYRLTHYAEFSLNPKIEDVKKGISLFKQNECDLVIAVGGGSSLDMAKSIAILSQHEGNIESYITKTASLGREGILLVAVPTTAGTGSESTHFAAVYINKTKYSLAHESMLPKHVILDPTLTATLPAKVTASTGIDALAQAVEAYWSINSTEESRKYSEQAISLILKNLPDAVNSPSSESREAMLHAANLAGKAINIAKTTACHALSYPITSYFDIPHGHAVALTLGEIFLFNAPSSGNSSFSSSTVTDPRGPAYVQENMNSLIRLFGVESAEQVKRTLDDLMDTIGLPRKLSALGISQEDFPIILENGFNPERMKNNPYKITREVVQKFLKNIA